VRGREKGREGGRGGGREREREREFEINVLIFSIASIEIFIIPSKFYELLILTF